MIVLEAKGTLKNVEREGHSDVTSLIDEVTI